MTTDPASVTSVLRTLSSGEMNEIAWATAMAWAARELDRLHEILVNTLAQSIGYDDHGSLDTRAISAYENAVEHLVSVNLAEWIAPDGSRSDHRTREARLLVTPFEGDHAR